MSADGLQLVVMTAELLLLLLLSHLAKEAVMLMLMLTVDAATAACAHFATRTVTAAVQRDSDCSGTARVRLAQLEQREWPLAHWATFQSTTDADLISVRTTCLQCTCWLPLCHCRLFISLHLFSSLLSPHVLLYASRKTVCLPSSLSL